MGDAPETVASGIGASGSAGLWSAGSGSAGSDSGRSGNRASGAGWTIQVKRGGEDETGMVTVVCGHGETVLAALRRTVARPKLGCRRGGCGVCKVNLLSGSVSYERVVAETVLPATERAEGVCLTCRAIPESDLVVELREEEGRKGEALLRLYQDVVERARRAQATAQPPELAAG